MGGLLSYSLSVSVIILLLYPVLYLITNRSRHFHFNRMSLLGGMLLSLALPFIYNAAPIFLQPESTAINMDSIITMDSSLSKVPANGMANDSATAFPWLPIVLIVYLYRIIFNRDKWLNISISIT